MAFVGVGLEGKPVPYRLRVKLAVEAQTLQLGLQKAAQAASSSAPPAPKATQQTQTSQSTEEATQSESDDTAVSAEEDAEGEDENEDEDETVDASVRSKVYKLADGTWALVGVGSLQVSRLPSGGSRVLLRSEPAGHVLVNFRLYKGLKIERTEKVVSFLGFDGTTPVRYRARFTSVGDATELAGAMQKATPDV